MHNANQALRAEAFKRANARFPDPGVGKDVQYRDPGRGGISDSMLMTDPNTGEIFRRGGGRSINQELAMKQPKKKEKRDLRRRAGDALTSMLKGASDFDRAYAKKIEDGIPFQKRGIIAMGRAVPLADIYKKDPTAQADSFVEKMGLHAMDAAVMTANVASRYALPAGGVTLAGKALIDLTAAYGGAADQPEPMTLAM